LVGKPEEDRGSDFVELLGVAGRIILECILGKYDGKLWSGFTWLRIGPSVGLM
jgi:hypothetical protein